MADKTTDPSSPEATPAEELKKETKAPEKSEASFDADEPKPQEKAEELKNDPIHKFWQEQGLPGKPQIEYFIATDSEKKNGYFFKTLEDLSKFINAHYSEFDLGQKEWLATNWLAIEFKFKLDSSFSPEENDRIKSAFYEGLNLDDSLDDSLKKWLSKEVLEDIKTVRKNLLERFENELQGNNGAEQKKPEGGFLDQNAVDELLASAEPTPKGETPSISQRMEELRKEREEAGQVKDGEPVLTQAAVDALLPPEDEIIRIVESPAEKEQQERIERDPFYWFFKDKGFKGDPGIRYQVEIAGDFFFPLSLEDLEELVKKNIDKLTKEQREQLRNNQTIWEVNISGEAFDWLVKNGLMTEAESIPRPKTEDWLPKKPSEQTAPEENPAQKERQEKLEKDPFYKLFEKYGYPDASNIHFESPFFPGEFTCVKDLQEHTEEHFYELSPEQQEQIKNGKTDFFKPFGPSLGDWFGETIKANPEIAGEYRNILIEAHKVEDWLPKKPSEQTAPEENPAENKAPKTEISPKGETQETIKGDPYSAFLAEQKITEPVFEYELMFRLGKGADSYKSFATLEELRDFVEKNSERFSPGQKEALEHGYGHAYSISLQKGKYLGQDLTRESRENIGHLFLRYLESHPEAFFLKRSPETAKEPAPESDEEEIIDLLDSEIIPKAEQKASIEKPDFEFSEEETRELESENGFERRDGSTLIDRLRAVYDRHQIKKQGEEIDVLKKRLTDLDLEISKLGRDEKRIQSSLEKIQELDQAISTTGLSSEIKTLGRRKRTLEEEKAKLQSKIEAGNTKTGEIAERLIRQYESKLEPLERLLERLEERKNELGLRTTIMEIGHREQLETIDTLKKTKDALEKPSGRLAGERAVSAQITEKIESGRKKIKEEKEELARRKAKVDQKILEVTAKAAPYSGEKEKLQRLQTKRQASEEAEKNEVPTEAEPKSPERNKGRLTFGKYISSWTKYLGKESNQEAVRELLALDDLRDGIPELDQSSKLDPPEFKKLLLNYYRVKRVKTDMISELDGKIDKFFGELLEKLAKKAQKK